MLGKLIFFAFILFAFVSSIIGLVDGDTFFIIIGGLLFIASLLMYKIFDINFRE